MKITTSTKVFFLFISLLFSTNLAFSQELKTSRGMGFELLFSSSNYNKPTFNTDPVVRFTGFFNWRNEWHYNFSKSVGLYTGFNIRNIGMINKYENLSTNENHKLKQRSYTLGLPLAFKFGNIDKTMYFFAGGEIELAFHYKEKRFDGNEKQYTKTAWFSDKTKRFIPSVFAGFQLPTGTNISFKYYLTDFLNKDYTNNNEKIYRGTSSNIFYVSVAVLIHDSMLRKLGNSKSPTVPIESAGL